MHCPEYQQYLPHQKETASLSETEAANSAAPDIPYQVVENLVGGAANPALIIYLHSNSGSGTDGKKQMSQVSAQNIEKYIKGNNIPAYFLVPQCPETHEWDSRGSTPGYYVKAKELIDYYLKEKIIDKSRIYICGTSMGAMGAWRMLRDYPGFFTAAIVSSGQAQFATPSLYTYLPYMLQRVQRSVAMRHLRVFRSKSKKLEEQYFSMN